MQLAWAASIVAQAWLLTALWCSGQRGWWECYLLYDLVRSAVLFPLDGHSYWLAWVLTEPIAMVLQMIAVQEVTGTRSRPLGVLLGVGAFAWSAVLTQQYWPTARRATLLLRQGCVYGCVGALVGAAADGICNAWLMVYYLLHVGRVVAEQLAVERSSVDQVSTVSLFAVSALFAAWGLHQLTTKRGYKL